MTSMITVTREELESDRFAPLWHWHRWSQAWGYIGFFAADLARRERALWSE